jgi:hypothetical protein
MSKSVYSIVLSGSVVELLDALAAREGVSRSAAINRILAEHLALDTPEKLSQDILERVVSLLEGGASAPPPSLSGGLLQVRMPVRFRYNPTLRCAVTLRPAPQAAQAELRAAARTQSAQFSQALDDFFGLFVRAAQLDPASCRIGGGRLVSRFALPLSDGDRAARQIAAQLNSLRRAMQDYFAEYPDPFNCERAVREACGDSGGGFRIRVRRV